MVKIVLLAILMFTSGIKAQEASRERHPSASGMDTLTFERCLHDGDRTRAARLIQDYLQTYNQSPTQISGSSRLLLAILEAWNGKMPLAKENFQQFIEIQNKQTLSADERSNRLLFRALELSAADKTNQAADSLLASIAARPASNGINRILLADSYSELAGLYQKTGDLYEASRNYERSIQMNRELGRGFMLAVDLNAYSPVLSMINATDPKADSVLRESFRIFGKMDSLSYQAQALNELGVLYNRRGNIRESLNYFIRSLSVKSRIARLPRQDFIIVTNNIGACYAYLGIPDSAKFYFARAIDYARQSGSNPAAYLVNLGTYYGLRNEYDEALDLFQKALNALDPECSATDLRMNPEASMASPQLAEFTAYKAHTFHRRYHLKHRKEDLVDGLNSFLSALNMIDTLRFMYSFESKPYLSSEAKIHYFNALDIALDLYQVTGDRKYLDQAFELSERNKSAILNEFLRTNQAREYMGHIAPWLIREDSLKQQINILKSSLVQTAETTCGYQDSSAIWRDRISSLTDELRQLESRARIENPDYFQMIYSTGDYSPGDLRKLLEPGEALIDYTVVRDTRLNQDYMVIMALTKDTLFTYRDTLPPDFRDVIRDFRTSVSQLADVRIFNDYLRSARQLDRYFFEPVEKFRGIDKLIILPDEEIGFLPFEAFLTDTLKPRGNDFRKLSYLNNRYSISYISSHEQFHQFRTGKVVPSATAVDAFAPFAGQSWKSDSLELPELVNSKKEAKAISKFYRTRIFLDHQADEAALVSAFQQSSVISLSTHGILDLVHPMQSRLLLDPSGQDPNLYLFELLSLKIRSPLVILNACNTGTGKLQAGEGILSMARGFQFAGARSVITTLWPIDDQSSAVLTKFFFRNIHDGMDVRQALKEARVQYLEQADRLTAAPFFWAGQVLVGDPGPIRIRERSGPWFPLAGLAIGLIVAALAIFRKKRV